MLRKQKKFINRYYENFLNRKSSSRFDDERYFYTKEAAGYTVEFQHKRFKRYIELLLREKIPVNSRILRKAGLAGNIWLIGRKTVSVNFLDGYQ